MIIVDPILDKIIFSFFPHRHDGNPALRYFDATHYGVFADPISFYSGKNKLVGGRYYTSENPEALVVFFHGAFAGRTAYGDVIAALAKQNYLVYAFDYTGCMQSEGRDCNLLGQPLLDQKAFFEFLEKDEKAKGLKRYAVGHSWGGYTVLGCLQEQYNVEKVVCISGFDNVVKEFLVEAPKADKHAKLLRGYFKRKYGELGNFDGLDAMKETSKEVLVLFGEQDNMVPVDKFYSRYKNELNEKPNIHFELVKERGHQPFYTKETQQYFINWNRENSKRRKEGLSSVEMDYSKIQLDPEVMNVIFDFLKR